MAKSASAPVPTSDSNVPVSTHVMTPEARLSYPNLFEPKAFQPGQKAKYSAVLVFSDKTSLKRLEAARNQACFEKWGPVEKWPKNLRSPFRDGNEKDQEGYKDCIYISVSSEQPPGVVNQSLSYITAKSGEIYAGCYVRATLNAYAYDHMGNRGVSFGLRNIQKTRDGQPFSGRKKAEEEFDAVEDSSEDQSSYGDADEKVAAADDTWA